MATKKKAAVVRKVLTDGMPGYDEATRLLIKAHLDAAKKGLLLPTAIECFIAAHSVINPHARINIKVT